MKIETSKLTGAALDWAVALIEKPGIVGVRPDGKLGAAGNLAFSPSTNWAQGGPIIEREKIAIDFDGAAWCASDNHKPLANYGPTPLIAAMRCYCASKLGHEVDVPDELC
jgi:hypothetical protein